MNDCLPEIPEHLKEKIVSLKTFGNCVIVYEGERCNASRMLKIASDDITSSSDLSRNYFVTDPGVLSVSKCYDCLFQPGTANWEKVETYIFTMGNGVNMTAGTYICGEERCYFYCRFSDYPFETGSTNSLL